MARNHELGIDVGGMKSAIIRDDGSLIIMARKTLSEFTENDWAVVVEISPVGVKNLKALLARDAQLRIGADEAGQGGASHTEDDVVTVGRVQDERHTWL